MRYIIVEYNPRDPDSPVVKVFAGRRQALEFANESPNTVRAFYVGASMTPTEIEADLLVRPERALPPARPATSYLVQTPAQPLAGPVGERNGAGSK